jgi:TonB-linked SusC/RagA family outer membrane protein
MRWGRPSVVLQSTTRSAVWRRWGVAALAAIGLAASGARLSAQANTGTITGTVKDATSGAPLAGAAVRVGATQIGTQTADDGKYTIRGVPAGAVSLQINRIGYEAKKAAVTVTAGGTATADVALSAAAFSLSEVVVTVTGAQKKAEIANTVASVDIAAKAQETTANSLGQLLSGQAAGVQISSAGAAGGGSRIRIRGQSSLSLSNSPVVYIDGVKVNSDASTGSATGASRFDDLNPDEIENIDILKGPAAATLYGTEAANGVINITTKKGRAGSTRWSFFGEAGQSHMDTNKFNDLWIAFDTANAAGVRTLTTCPLLAKAAGTCTQDSIYHGNVLKQSGLTPITNGMTGKFGAQVSGGSDRNQYFLSGEYNKETGPYKMPQAEVNRLQTERGGAVPYNQIFPNADTRVNLRSNLSTQLGSKADFNVSLGYLERTDRQPQNEDNSVGLMVDAIAGNARTDLVDTRGNALNGYNIYPIGDILAQETTSDVNRFTNSLNARYYPFAWLSTRANLGFDFVMNHRKSLTRFEQGPCCGTSRQGSVSDTRTEDDQYTADIGATATFNPTSSINTKTSVGVQYFRAYNDQSSGSGSNLTPGATQAGAGATESASSGTATTVTFGNYAEEVVSFADKFFLNGGLRYDGNSSFGRSFKGVLYPKVGASYLISDENFFPKTDWLSSFRLRATYGASGVQPSTTAATRFLSPNVVTVGGVDIPGVSLGSVGNANLKPEYSGEFEGGFDATTFHGHTTFEYTYYNKKTKDALISAPLAPSVAGLSSVFKNLGSIRNQGNEVTMNNRILDNNEYGFDLQLTGSTNKNRILTLGQGITPITTGAASRGGQYNAPGYPLYGQWGKVIGYNDTNGDGLLAVNEVCQQVNTCRAADTAVYQAPSFPTLEFAVNPRLELLKRKLAITAQLDSKQGMDKFNNTHRHQCNVIQSCQWSWDPTTSLDDQARDVADANYSVYTGLLENGRFTRLREVTVSYQLPDRLANRLRSSRATIVAAGRNLAIWTPYTGVDPEATVGNGDQRGNEEYFSTPPLRYFTVRLNLNF